MMMNEQDKQEAAIDTSLCGFGDSRLDVAATTICAPTAKKVAGDILIAIKHPDNLISLLTSRLELHNQLKNAMEGCLCCRAAIGTKCH